MPSALITGITGQDGSYLAELLLSKGYEVFGLARRSTLNNYEGIAHIQDQITFLSGDLINEVSLIQAVRTAQPDEVYNLGAQSFVGTSFNQPTHTGDVTGLSVTRLLNAILHEWPSARFYQASTSEMFGRVTSSPQTVDTPFHPRSPYGVAKLYGHWMTVNFRETHGLYAASGILFNHESPRRGFEFVTRKITHSAAQISLGLETEVRLGDLNARRDWGFAGDYVRAIWLMLQQDEPRDYVIGSGATHSVADLCRVAFEHVGLNYLDHVVVDPRYMRPTEPHQLVSDPTRAMTELGWKPEVSFEELVRSMVDADLDLLQGRLRSLR